MSVADLALQRSDDGARMMFSFPQGARDVLVVAMVDEATHQRVWVLKSEKQLGRFEYGRVPPGFQQVLPIGTPPPLQRGWRYSVVVVGGVGAPVGMLTFTA